MSHSCSAPICAQEDSHSLANWYPDETVCNSVPQTSWQTKMKRIQKLAGQGKIDPNRFFTIAMLDSIDLVRPNLAGIDPDQTPEERDAAIKEFIENPNYNRSRRSRLV